jgi:hypothetical protein
MKKLFTNIEYIKLAITITLSFGVLSAFMTILDQCLKALGYSNSGSITSIIFLISTPTGILFVPFFIGILKKTQKYRLLSSLCKN